MALVRCLECNHEVSSLAKMCPHCGYQKPGRLTNSLQTVFWYMLERFEKWSYIPKKYPYLKVLGMAMLGTAILQSNADKGEKYTGLLIATGAAGFLLYVVMGFLEGIANSNEKKMEESENHSKDKYRQG